ncbi:SDR family NAD(P)-dependent oxidoreductase [Frondihabitans sucicola]|uniref:SDR family NAD(P)-dependent oxidoreductase n=1 Tax=Frondihabitans sucicola TaxID=1268041 RepID=UPI002573A591|nr:SDR family NAD(P)-dependent oxidoreductase [Frondihabitans sucicola]
MNFTEYKGKRVVVTGVSSGIGEATARALIDLGAEVHGVSRREPGASPSPASTPSIWVIRRRFAPPTETGTSTSMRSSTAPAWHPCSRPWTC